MNPSELAGRYWKPYRAGQLGVPVLIWIPLDFHLRAQVWRHIRSVQLRDEWGWAADSLGAGLRSVE